VIPPPAVVDHAFSGCYYVRIKRGVGIEREGVLLHTVLKAYNALYLEHINTDLLVVLCPMH
jgi:hypothetical protein